MEDRTGEASRVTPQDASFEADEEGGKADTGNASEARRTEEQKAEGDSEEESTRGGHKAVETPHTSPVQSAGEKPRAEEATGTQECEKQRETEEQNRDNPPPEEEESDLRSRYFSFDIDCSSYSRKTVLSACGVPIGAGAFVLYIELFLSRFPFSPDVSQPARFILSSTLCVSASLRFAVAAFLLCFLFTSFSVFFLFVHFFFFFVLASLFLPFLPFPLFISCAFSSFPSSLPVLAGFPPKRLEVPHDTQISSFLQDGEALTPERRRTSQDEAIICSSSSPISRREGRGLTPKSPGRNAVPRPNSNIHTLSSSSSSSPSSSVFLDGRKETASTSRTAAGQWRRGREAKKGTVFFSRQQRRGGKDTPESEKVRNEQQQSAEERRRNLAAAAEARAARQAVLPAEERG